VFPCPGNSAQICGGNYAGSLYALPAQLPIGATVPPVVTTAAAIVPTTVPPTRASTYSAASRSFIACYIDVNPAARVLPNKLSSSTSQTIDTCGASAYALGYQYFALQYGVECWAGQLSSAQLSTASQYYNAAACTYPCAGNTGQTCGGFYAGDLYKLGP